VVLKTKRTRHVPLLDQSGEAYEATAENVMAGKYPLTRFLYVYVNKAAGKELTPATREFLRFVLSSDGQRVAAAGGNLPLTTGVVVKERGALGE
jgi:phosphate transport system substrate-binding protein